MDPENVRYIPPLVVATAFAFVGALRLPELLRQRNPNSLEYILSNQRVESLKEELAAQYGLSPQQIKIEREQHCRTTCATNSQGGILATYNVTDQAGNHLTTLYWKQDPNLVQGRFPLLRQKTTRIKPTEVELSAQAHQVLTEQNITCVARPLCIDSLMGVITMQVPGTDLATLLTDEVNLEQRRTLFRDTLTHLTTITKTLQETPNYKTSLNRSRSKNQCEGKRHQTDRYLEKNLEAQEIATLDSALGLWSKSQEVIHADLNPANIIITPQKTPAFVDITPDLGEWYEQAYKLQWELGLIDDLETNSFIKKQLKQRGMSNVTPYKAQVQAKSHLQWAAKTALYLEQLEGKDVTQDVRSDLESFLIYNLEKVQSGTSPQARSVIKKLLEQAARLYKIEQEPHSARIRSALYERGIAQDHPWQKAHMAITQPEQDPIATYRKQIKQARKIRESDLTMTYLSGVTAEIGGMVAGILKPEIVTELWYIPALIGIPLLMYLNSRFKTPYRRDSSF